MTSEEESRILQQHHLLHQCPDLQLLFATILSAPISLKRITKQICPTREHLESVPKDNLVGLCFEYHLYLLVSDFLRQAPRTVQRANLDGIQTANYLFWQRKKPALGTISFHKGERRVASECDQVLSLDEGRIPVIVEAKTTTAKWVHKAMAPAEMTRKRKPLAEAYQVTEEHIPYLLVVMDDGARTAVQRHAAQEQSREAALLKFYADGGLFLRVPANLSQFSANVKAQYNRVKRRLLAMQSVS